MKLSLLASGLPLAWVLSSPLPPFAAPFPPPEGLVAGPAQSTAPAPAPAPEPARAPQARPGGGAPPSEDAVMMGSPPALPEGMTEEEMWPAATDEGWQKPCLVRWQRTFEDALRVARAENRPILVAVNMDGEIASEHFAGVRYRSSETAAAMAPYVCLVASVYRHTPRDYDEEGRRVLCPRFGSVTCGEHVEVERELYAKYFDEKRVAPRHIVLGLEGEETYDVYFSWDTQTVFTTFVKGLEGWPEPNPPPERTLPNLAQSSDVEDREALERAYRDGDRETKRAILSQLLEVHVVDQVEVLRAAIFGLDLELAASARRALAQGESDAALELLAETLKAPLDTAERELLLGTVKRLAETSPRARTLAALHGGLSSDSRLIDVASLVEATDARAAEYEANAVLSVDVQTRAEAAAARPEDAGALLALAEALYGRARESGEREFQSLLLEDAHAALGRAERAGATSPRLDGLVALVLADQGQRGAARERALRAVEAGLLRLADPSGESDVDRAGPAAPWDEGARVRLLELFAEAREHAIRGAFRRGETWPPEWLSDVNAAYAVIAESDAVLDQSLVGYHDFLRWIGATPRANDVLDAALARFPASPALHERLRGRLLWESGPDGLEHGYEALLASSRESEARPALEWFAAYASLVAAEHHRRRGESAAALASYARAVPAFASCADKEPAWRDSCDNGIALADAGRARIALERGDLLPATEALLACFERRPESAATPDGLGLTPVMTARMLQARLRDAQDGARADRLQAALDKLDPKLLEPPPSELPGGRGPRGARPGARPGPRPERR